MTESRGRQSADMNLVISNLLKYGVVISAILVAFGVLVLFLKTPQSFPTTVAQLVASNYGKPTLNLSQLLGEVASANPIFVIQLGLIVLLATPVARVAASVIMFAAEKDRLYVVITLFVLVVLLIGLLIVGPMEAAG